MPEKCLSGGPQIWKSLNGGTLARKAYMYMSMADPGVTLVLDWNSLHCNLLTVHHISGGEGSFPPMWSAKQRLCIACSWVWKITHWVSYTAVLFNSQQLYNTTLDVCAVKKTSSLFAYFQYGATVQPWERQAICTIHSLSPSHILYKLTFK